MILTIESSVKDEFYKKATIEIADNCELSNVYSTLAELCVAYGYHIKSVQDVFENALIFNEER